MLISISTFCDIEKCRLHVTQMPKAHMKYGFFHVKPHNPKVYFPEKRARKQQKTPQTYTNANE